MNQVNRRCWGLPLGGVEGCLEKMRFRRRQNELYSVKSYKVTGQKTDVGLQMPYTWPAIIISDLRQQSISVLCSWMCTLGNAIAVLSQPLLRSVALH